MIRQRLEGFQAEISRSPSAALIAVSKQQPLGAILEAYEGGQRDFGENYVQELLEKDAALRARGIEDIRWHFIGHLQTNKVKALLPAVSVVHSVGSLRLAREISKRWVASGRAGRLSVFLEVNIDEEPSKGGFAPAELPAALPELGDLPGLEWRGLMCIPSPQSGQSGEAFRRLVALERQCQPVTRGELSMGMSDDYLVALREGASATKLWIRIGTALFGARNPA